MSLTLRLRVASKTPVAETVARFDLLPHDGTVLPPFTAGAHIRVQTPGGPVRAYSLCNDPADAGRYQIAVHLDAASRGGSVAMHRHLQPGDLLTASAPANQFPLHEDAPHTLLLAGGIGITPLLAMAWRLHNLGASFELHVAARTAARCPFTELLRSAPFADRVHLHLDDGTAGRPLDIQQLLANAPNDTHLYVCGPAGLIDLAMETGRNLGWPAVRLHNERFGADTGPQPESGNRAFRVVLVHSGLTLDVPADRSVAAVVQAAGVDLPTCCEQGVCGTCITDVLGGTPDHRDQCLSEKDRERCFTPCCSRALTETLNLAL